MKKLLLILCVLFMVSVAYGQELIPETAIKLKKAETELRQKDAEIAALKAEILGLKKGLNVVVSFNKAENLKPPFLGDETTISSIRADVSTAIKPFILVGGLKPKDEYKLTYKNARGTHISVGFEEIAKDGTANSGREITLYLKKSRAHGLIEAIAKSELNGHKGIMARVRAVLPHMRFDNVNIYGHESPADVAEILDWQYLSKDNKWGNWEASKIPDVPRVNLGQGRSDSNGVINQEGLHKMLVEWSTLLTRDATLTDSQWDKKHDELSKSIINKARLSKFACAIKTKVVDVRQNLCQLTWVVDYGPIGEMPACYEWYFDTADADAQIISKLNLKSLNKGDIKTMKGTLIVDREVWYEGWWKVRWDNHRGLDLSDNTPNRVKKPIITKPYRIKIAQIDSPPSCGPGLAVYFTNIVFEDNKD